MNIFIVDDHPIVVKLYESMLSRDLHTMEGINFITASNCREAYDQITKAALANIQFDLALLDQSLPSYGQKNMYSGTDIAQLLRANGNQCKIIMITSHTEILVVYDILKKVMPEGIAIKNDITDDNFGPMVRSVLGGNLFRSAMVKSCVDKVWERDIMVEESNRQILLLLSKGYKTAELEPIVRLAPRTIEKRIAEIRKIFGVNDNVTLLRAAVRDGFL